LLDSLSVDKSGHMSVTFVFLRLLLLRLGVITKLETTTIIIICDIILFCHRR